MIQHQVIPADGCEGVGAALHPAASLDKVLVLSVSESIAKYYMESEMFVVFFLTLEKRPETGFLSLRS